MRWLVFAVLVAACGSDKVPYVEPPDFQARAEFPDLARLYDGDHGLYRGCGPNGNVCHNGNEFPNLDSVGSILDGISRDCNQKRDRADAIHDMCERTGDFVEIRLPDGPDPDTDFDVELIELASITPVLGSGEPPRTFSVKLRRAPTSFMNYQPMRVFRDEVALVNLRDGHLDAVIDPSDPTGRSITLTLAANDYGLFTSQRLMRVGIPGFNDIPHVGDPNGNGIFGAEIGGKLIKPGDPQRSYLLRRLTDPTAGPLMPRANCCYWTKPALRALWCWVAGLEEDASNALAAIDYDNCPASPAVELDYPDPVEGCETAGRCPVVAIGGTGEPTFRSIYAEIFVPKCAGSGCHSEPQYAGDVDLRNELAAYDTLQAKIVAGNPNASELARRLDPATCTAPCATMPLDRELLLEADVMRIRQWIADGAAP